VNDNDDEHLPSSSQRSASECIGASVQSSDRGRLFERDPNWWLSEAFLDYGHFAGPRKAGRQPPPNYTFKTGIVVKQGWWAKTWKRRLFVLDGALLRYYDPVERGWPKGTIPLANVTGVFLRGDELRVVTPKRTYRLVASDGANGGWLRAIQQNMQALRAAPVVTRALQRTL
jgi:hypothetical protein